MLKHSVFAVSAAVLAMAASSATFAMGGASGASVNYPTQGKLGAIIVNPYDIAPLTAIIRNGGYVLSKVSVRIVPKQGGQEIKYNVSDAQLRTHGGIPVFGLYGDYRNQVEVSYTKTMNGKAEKVSKEMYTIYASPVSIDGNGAKGQDAAFFKTEVKKVDPKFSDRLYLVNNMLGAPAKSTRAVWNNPAGGALEWNRYPMNAVLDTKGEIRWYMNPSKIYDFNDIYKAGIMMGFRQNRDGAFTWGYGQRYVKYDIMGREIFNHKLPDSYCDFSHSMDPMQNGNYLVRVASADHKRPDGKHVRTVRDVIIEVDQNGNVVDEWRLFDILDPYRDIVLKSLDQGAVCLNIDATKAGKTMSTADLAELDKSDNFGDIVGTGAGRNWVHVNSVDYDPSDDSIIISSRHQSAIIKIGRDKKVKWILGAPEGWRNDFAKRVLQPVEKNGKKIECSGGKCDNTNFDWTWTQHTAFRIDSKSDKNVIYVSAFDNGDGRGLEQPAIPSMKYSRSVIYKIDQRKMTVEQVWEYGKERGNSWYSPVTSITEYMPDKDSVFAYSATAGATFDFKSGAFTSAPNPFINEFKWGAKEPSVEIQLKKTSGYQAMVFNVEQAFNADLKKKNK